MLAVGALSSNKHDAHSVRLLSDFGMLDYQFEEADIRRARRAYYGAISYIDGMVARVMEALRATGADKTTAIVFTSDHGEMLSERGMWFKKHFFEKALRVPLFISAPWITPQRVSELISLVDLLPTFNGLALGSPSPSAEEELEGIDLTRLLDSDAATSERTIYAEYLAEATLAPIFMIRRGQYKFISSTHDPDLLFDLEKDPRELTNLAANPDLNMVVDAFSTEVREKWDVPELAARIVQSQKRRLRIRSAMSNGAPNRWNHDEDPRDKVLWYRGEGSYNDWAFNYLPVSS